MSIFGAPRRGSDCEATATDGTRSSENERGSAMRSTRFDRRRFLQFSGTAGLSGLAVRSLWPTQAAASAIGLPPIRLTSATGLAATTAGVVMVPAPTGVASTDTANALASLNSPPGTTVVFQASASAVYVINQELPVPPGIRITGYGGPCEQPHLGLMPTLQQAKGTSLRCLLASAAYLAGLYNTSQYNGGTPNSTPDFAIEVDHIAFDGQNGGGQGGGGNTVGHGLVLFAEGSAVHDCFFYNIAQAAIVVADCNYAGTAATGSTNGNRVYDNKVTDPGAEGILVTNTSGAPGSLAGFMLNNVIESPSLELMVGSPDINPATGVPYEAIRMEMAAGWWVINNHAYACPGNGMYFGTPWGMWATGNAIDSFGCIPQAGKTYIGFYFDVSGSTDHTEPILVNQNQLSACEGFDLFSPTAPSASNTFQYYVVNMDEASWGNTTWFEQSSNSAHQDSQPPSPINPATVQAGSTTVSVPHGSTKTNVQRGMTITDSLGYIPAGTTVAAVASGSGTAPDVITLSVAATGTSSSDTLSFIGPRSIAWTYVNNLAGSSLTVNRTNEIVSGTVDPTPAISGVGSVNILDPANFAGGIPVTGTPAANDVLVASSATTATWAPYSSITAGPATFVIASSGAYTVPASATQLRVVCVGGGGGGGGGGASSSPIPQVGGSGGSAGTTSSQIVSVRGNSTLSVTIGSGGSGGSGGAAGGDNVGGDGTAGGNTTVTGAGISVCGTGGPGGRGAVGGSTQTSEGSAYGGHQGQTTSGVTGGCGGGSGAGGGSPIEYSPGGGGGGGSSSTTAGGDGGMSGSSNQGGSPGGSGKNSTSSGIAGASASSPGAGGGGGGGGTNGQPGGAGGSGAPGFAIIEVVG